MISSFQFQHLSEVVKNRNTEYDRSEHGDFCLPDKHGTGGETTSGGKQNGCRLQVQRLSNYSLVYIGFWLSGYVTLGTWPGIDFDPIPAAHRFCFAWNYVERCVRFSMTDDVGILGKPPSSYASADILVTEHLGHSCTGLRMNKVNLFSLLKSGCHSTRSLTWEPGSWSK